MKIGTDSFYMAIACGTIDECVKSDLKEEWQQEKWKFLTLQDKTPVNFNSHTITLKDYNKITPGKYKEEFNGICRLALNSKVYHIVSNKIDPKIEKSKQKLHAKVYRKKRNELVRKNFLSIMENPTQEHLLENAGFIRDG